MGVPSIVPAPSGLRAVKWFIRSWQSPGTADFFLPPMSHIQFADPIMQLGDRIDAARLKRNELLAPYTTFRIGGPADLFYDATSADDLANAITAARQAAVPFFVLGLG